MCAISANVTDTTITMTCELAATAKLNRAEARVQARQIDPRKGLTDAIGNILRKRNVYGCACVEAWAYVCV